MDKQIIPPEEERAACAPQQEAARVPDDALPDGIDNVTIYSIMTSRHKTTFFRVVYPVFRAMMLGMYPVMAGTILPYVLLFCYFRWFRKTELTSQMLFSPEMKPIFILVFYVVPLLVILGVLLATRNNDPYKARLCGIICGSYVHGVNIFSFYRLHHFQEMAAGLGLDWTAFEVRYQTEGYILTAIFFILFVLLLLLVPYRLALKKYRKLTAASEAGKP